MLIILIDAEWSPQLFMMYSTNLRVRSDPPLVYTVSPSGIRYQRQMYRLHQCHPNASDGGAFSTSKNTDVTSYNWYKESQETEDSDFCRRQLKYMGFLCLKSLYCKESVCF